MIPTCGGGLRNALATIDPQTDAGMEHDDRGTGAGDGVR